MTSLNPYISFKDNADEAMEFYKIVFGGKLTKTTFKQGGVPCEPSEENHIMHSELEAENGMIFMASDTPMSMKYQTGKGISMSLSGDNEAELRGYWDKLAVGAEVEQPLVKAPWGDTFGMLFDQFGIRWMVNITAKKL